MRNKKMVGIFLVVCLLSILSIQARANVLWQEDFEDGDYDGWVVVEGAFDASSKYLEATQSGWNTIYNKSEVACGQWLYDLHEDPVVGLDYHVFFIGYETQNISGYSLSLEYGPISNLTLYLWEIGEKTVLDRGTIPTDNIAWVNYNISRNSDGFFQVVRVSEVFLSAEDDTYIASQNFLFNTEEDGAIDNITIIDCDYTPTTTTTGNGFTMPLLIGAVILTIAAFIIWWYRRH
ncbi:MAG: hypothetical protein KAU48_03855 [Candidatus Thorarchaeota archaeon]|nr:hypothetical protein [Candidatus Thorarchaeota archaeon]